MPPEDTPGLNFLVGEIHGAVKRLEEDVGEIKKAMVTREALAPLKEDLGEACDGVKSLTAWRKRLEDSARAREPLVTKGGAAKFMSILGGLAIALGTLMAGVAAVVRSWLG